MLRTFQMPLVQACMTLLKKDNNAVSDKLKVSHSLTSGGTFVVYIVHPMCSGELFLRLCLLGTFQLFIHSNLLIESLIRHVNKYFFFLYYLHIGLV